MHLKSILSVTFTSLFLTTVRAKSAAATVPDAELDALLDLYHSTNGPTWRKNQWPKEVAQYQSGGTEAGRRALKPCAWKGVSCKRGHIVALSLEHALNGGQLPASLALLSEVEVLDLGSNNLEGALPAAWGNGLRKCYQIEMDGNHFQGKIPEEWAAFVDSRAPPREGASAGGARIFLGFNEQRAGGSFGFECPYPSFLLNKTRVTRGGRLAKDSNIATSWGLPPNCGLTAQDQTPDEEKPARKKTGNKQKRGGNEL